MQEVNAEETLYRRSFATPQKNYLNPDGSATSRVFKLRSKDEGKLSVDVKSLTSVETTLGDAERFMLFEIANETVIETGRENNIELKTIHDPLPNEQAPDITNPAHALIVGMELDDDIIPSLLAKKSKRVSI